MVASFKKTSMTKPLLPLSRYCFAIFTFINQKLNMKKVYLLTLLFALFTTLAFSQTDKFWTASYESFSNINKDKAVARLSFPTVFKLFTLNTSVLRQELFTVVGSQASRHSTIISLPNADGQIEKFEVVEASNFEPALQAQFPGIRAFSGKGITDKSATLKLSISDQGIQTMIFRTEKANEFIEPYSSDHTVYAVFISQRKPGQLPWTCSTQDQQLATGLNAQVSNAGFTSRSGGDLKTMRLAQSCNAEYSNYFGATSAAQVGLVLAAFNATLTRCNGVYEKDLALHLNLIANTTSVIYYTASSDPYTTLSSWNAQLQSTLTSVIGEANYDIGHMFGASGGGGNAGCIGCVCSNGSKGSGITSPVDGIPQGDNFDIDYVVHEVGHQLGGNHTFSHSLEGSGVNKEVGSGITIMGYAGITSQDVAPHSIDIYHQATIAQIQANLLTKTCPVTTVISATNATPVVAAVSNYTIPKSTPFALTGSATDANAGDVLTYCWEQNDNSTVSGASSVASATKASGPNWISFSPTTSPTRYFPKLSTILAGALISGPLPGGDAVANTEALSSVGRTLNFRLTVRDNAPYSSTVPVSVAQTAFTDMVVTVNAASGPFAVSAPNTAVTYPGGSSQTITWAVAGSTAAPVSCANVKISLSTDGGQTFPTVLIASTANDGSEVLVIPNTPTNTGRIKVEAVGNIFFDISNANFTITSASSFSSITTSAVSPLSYCAGAAVSVSFTTNGAASAGNVFTAELSNAAGSFASPVAIGTLTGTGSATIAATIPAVAATGVGYRIRVVSSNPVITGSDNGTNISVTTVPSASAISAAGATTICQGGTVVLNGNVGGTWSNGATTASITVSTAGTYFVTNSNSCGNVQSNSIVVTVNPLPTVTASNVTGCAGSAITLTGSPAGGTFSVANPYTGPSTTYTYTYTNANGCTVTSAAATITVNPLPTVTASNVTGCAGSAIILTGFPAGGTFSVANPYSGPSTTYTYTYSNANGCTVTSAAATITVNPLPTVTASNVTGCAGSAITLTGSPAGGSFSIANPYTGPSTTYTYTYTDPLTGCAATSSAASVTVNPLPVVSFSGLASSYPVNAATITLVGSPAGGSFSGPGISGNTFSPATAGVGGPYSITYSYTNANGCSNNSSLQTTVNAACAAPARPGTITTVGGTAKVCPGDIKSYTISAVSGATSYTWTAPIGGVVTTGQGTSSVTVTYTAGFTVGDSLRVTANNSCGSSIARALIINRNSVAATPGVITGQIYGVCNSNAIPYSVVSVAGVSYNWTSSVAGVSIASGQGTNSITANFAPGYVSGALRVTATNACGTSAARSLTVYARPALATSITGSTSVCAGQLAVPYSIAAIPNATNYTWYCPTGAKISDGVVTSTGTSLTTTATSITVNFGNTGGLVRVKGINSCASGSVASLSVALTACRQALQPSKEIMIAAESDMQVYPNPSNGDFKINLPNSKGVTTSKVVISNEFGQVVYQGTFNNAKGMIELKLNDKLSSGIYLVSCITNGIKTVKKLIISK